MATAVLVWTWTEGNVTLCFVCVRLRLRFLLAADVMEKKPKHSGTTHVVPVVDVPTESVQRALAYCTYVWWCFVSPVEWTIVWSRELCALCATECGLMSVCLSVFFSLSLFLSVCTCPVVCTVSKWIALRRQ